MSTNETTGTLSQLLAAIEAVRVTRQAEYRERCQPQLKRFTQQELNDEACPTYKNWLSGRSTRLPGRAMLLNIADYLECSLSERNDLLLAAQYLPEQPDWEGESLRSALAHARALMETLPYPSMVVTRSLHVQSANASLLRLLELPPLETLPPQQRNTLQLLFRPDVRARSTFNAEACAV